MNFNDYINGNRHGKEANRLEQEMLNDPFLSEAADGFDKHPGENHIAAIEALEKDILRQTKNKRPAAQRFWYAAIAASIALLLALPLLIRQQKPEEIIVAGKMPEDTLKNDTLSQQMADSKLIAQERTAEKKKDILQTKIKTTAENMELSEETAVKEHEEYVAAPQITDEIQIADNEMEIATSSAAQGEKNEAKMQEIEKLSSKPQPKIIRGKVIDERGEPLIGASVVLTESKTGTLTDVNGNFKLNAENAEKTEIQVSYIGYDTQTVAVNRDSATVHMNENQLALSEVIVTGYTAQRKETTTTATAGKTQKPEFDREKFMTYFNENRKNIECEAENPTIKAEFFVSGAGKPEKITVVESNCKKLENEFRRLLNKTSNWTAVSEKIILEIRL